MKKIDIKGLITDERAAELRRNPVVERLLDLGEKIDGGTATDEEIAEYDRMTAASREIDPTVLTD